MFLPSKAGGFAKQAAQNGASRAREGEKNSRVGQKVQNNATARRLMPQPSHADKRKTPPQKSKKPRPSK
jgi:hypothetical protein